MRYPSRFGQVILLFILVTNISFAQEQTARYNTSMGENTNGFYEYLPQSYSSSNDQYPLIIFIHGLGDRGNGNPVELKRVLQNGIPKMLDEGTFPVSIELNNKSFEFIILSPQFIEWPEPDHVDNVINYAINNYRVDINRIYLTGLSMGGGAVWDYAGNNSIFAKKIAAIVPVCGGSWPEPERAYIIGDADLPVWATHNDGDPTVPVHYTHDYVSRINSRSPNPPAKKTIFDDDTHDAWTKTYDPSFTENGLNIYQWMLQYQRTTSVLPVILKDYKAYKVNATQAMISWSTTDEINNQYFTIERSLNGSSFTEIGKIEAKNQPHHYSFKDEHPVKGVNYYRLSQTDIDGSIKYFSILKLNFEAENKIFSLAPNPATSYIKINLERDENGPITIRLISNSGKLVKQWSFNKHTYGFNQDLEISSLSPGLYFIEARGKTFTHISNFIKNN